MGVPSCLLSVAASTLVMLVALAGCADDAVIPDSGIEGTVWYGPTCPVVQNPPDPQCADRRYETDLAVYTADGVEFVTKFSSDANGTFRVAVEPGTYSIGNAPGSNQLPYCSTQEAVRVEAHAYTEAMVSCDSGIR